MSDVETVVEDKEEKEGKGEREEVSVEEEEPTRMSNLGEAIQKRIRALTKKIVRSLSSLSSVIALLIGPGSTEDGRDV